MLRRATDIMHPRAGPGYWKQNGLSSKTATALFCCSSPSFEPGSPPDLMCKETFPPISDARCPSTMKGAQRTFFPPEARETAGCIDGWPPLLPLRFVSDLEWPEPLVLTSEVICAVADRATAVVFSIGQLVALANHTVAVLTEMCQKKPMGDLHRPGVLAGSKLDIYPRDVFFSVFCERSLTSWHLTSEEIIAGIVLAARAWGKHKAICAEIGPDLLLLATTVLAAKANSTRDIWVNTRLFYTTAGISSRIWAPLERLVFFLLDHNAIVAPEDCIELMAQTEKKWSIEAGPPAVDMPKLMQGVNFCFLH